jgi:ribosomal protein S8
MQLTDPVADFLTRIRNSIRARHQKLDVPASRLKTEIARILKEEGYIANYKPGRGRQEDSARVSEVRREQRSGHPRPVTRFASGLPRIRGPR